jgi:hypothetical protein
MSYDSSILQEAYQGNLTTLPELQLRCRLTDVSAANLCHVSPETYRRWKRDRLPNPTAVRLMAILAGYVPWPGWDGWEVHNGYLFPPGYVDRGITPGQILATPFREQLLSLYQRQLTELRQSQGAAAPGRDEPAAAAP